MKSMAPDPVQATFAFVGEDNPAVAFATESRESRAGALMPLEAAAKAIFVKADGLPAYRKATGLSRRHTDANERNRS